MARNNLANARRSKLLFYSLTSALVLALSACGGGGGSGGGVNFTPPPPAPPPPPPPPPTANPIANASPALLPGSLTPSPQPIEAVQGSSGFAGLNGTATFPMLQTVPIPGTFAGDTVATEAGGTISVTDSGSAFTYGFTVNSPVPRLSLTVEPSSSLAVHGEDLDYTRFGNWAFHYSSEGPVHHGVWNVGYLTPVSAIPTNGQASYSGKTTGLYDERHPCGCLQAITLSFSGDMALTADFSARTLSGSFTNLALWNGVLPSTLNDVAFTAAIDPTRNWFSGQTSVTSYPTGPQAFTSGASGSVRGMFYGPTANEVGGIWTLSDSVRRLTGAFGGRGN